VCPDRGAPDEVLDERTFPAGPFEQFLNWYRGAIAAGIPQPEAMTLATATPDGRPSARMVLLKDVDDQGFTFYTNYRSRKGRELEANPRAALVFHWATAGRQVRVEGTVARVSAEASDRYFERRPPGSRISASVSPQSEVVSSREGLERAAAALGASAAHHPIPRPSHWGGYRLVPDSVEFWLHRADRLHDRLRYVRVGERGWRLERLAP